MDHASQLTNVCIKSQIIFHSKKRRMETKKVQHNDYNVDPVRGRKFQKHHLANIPWEALVITNIPDSVVNKLITNYYTKPINIILPKQHRESCQQLKVYIATAAKPNLLCQQHLLVDMCVMQRIPNFFAGSPYLGGGVQIPYMRGSQEETAPLLTVYCISVALGKLTQLEL